MTARLALGALFLAAVLVSLLWWRNDGDGCSCETCPDGFCVYGDRVAAVLENRDHASLVALRQFGHDYTHSHSPLAPLAIGALEATVLPRQPVAAFALANVAFGALGWLGLRRIAGSLELPSPMPEGALFAVFFTQFLVLRSLARPSTDLLGMVFTIWVLEALGREILSPSRARGFALASLEGLAQLSRVSCVPLLALPALAALVQDRPIADRLRGAIRCGVLFGLIPAAVAFGSLRLLGFENLAMAWQFGHRAGFVADFTVHNFLLGIAVSGQATLAIGLLWFAGSRAQARSPILRIHLAWIALYLTYLLMGRTALWVRYFLPIVPSCAILATPAMAWAARARPGVLWVAVLLLAAANGLGIVRLTRDPDLVPAARLLWHDLSSALSGRELAVGRAHEAPESIPSSPVLARAPRSTIDGDVDTRWSPGGAQIAGTSLVIDLPTPRVVRSLSLWSRANAFPRAFAVEGRRGDAWVPLARATGAEATTGFFDVRAHTDVALAPADVTAVRIRLLEDAAEPWSIDELRIAVAPPGVAVGPSGPVAGDRRRPHDRRPRFCATEPLCPASRPALATAGRSG